MADKKLRPKRGKKDDAISQSIVLANGEVFFEYPDEGIGTGFGKIKMGDGKTSYKDLPYYLGDVAGSEFGLIKSGGDLTITDGVATVNDDSHNHIVSNVDGLQSALDNKVPTTRKVNGKALSGDITLSASDVGADASGSANTALTNAKEYINSKIADEVTARNSAIDNAKSSAISTAASDAKTKADNALASAKTYADSVGTKVKNDLLNGAGSAYDTLSELGALIDENQDAIDALETIASGKADKEHTHDDRYYTESEIDSKLSGKANSSHGTHVSYSTTAPAMDGTASVGSASTVARSDHKHPTDTTRASASDLTSHIGNTTVHITSTERTNWNDANSKKHSHSNKTVLDNTTASFTTEEKNKLAGIASGANAYSLPSAGSSLGGVKSGGDVTISSGVITVNDDSHNHVISNVDGLQSALDGKAASSHGNHVPTTCTTITDWNNATTTGWYMASGASNAPTTGSTWYFGHVIAHTTNYVFQEVYQFTASINAKDIPKYIRAKMNGTWGNWVNVTVAKAVPSDAVFTDNNTIYTHPSTHPASMITGLATVATSGKYSDLSGIPTIPTKTSQLTNDSGFKTTDTTYSAATTSTNGLMTSAMVTKLNGITDSADSVSFSRSLTSGTKIGTITINGTATDLYCQTNTDNNTLNTAGSTNTSSKIFLVGATSQAANPQTYSHDTAYVGTDGCLYSNNKKVTTMIYSTTEPTSNLDVNMVWIQ